MRVFKLSAKHFVFRIFKKYVEISLAEYEAVLEKISRIESLVRKHFEFSEDQSNALLKKKETAKTIARDHQVLLIDFVSCVMSNNHFFWFFFVGLRFDCISI